MLTLLTEIPPDKSVSGYWEVAVRCDCGKEFTIRRSAFSRRVSCGCARPSCIGTRYGKLEVIATVGNRRTCRCDCGNIVKVWQSNLASGKKTCCRQCKRNPK